MESSLIDITAQVPEVSPGDFWADAAGFDFDSSPATSVLPPKRPRAENPPSTAASGRNGPLRIAPQAPQPSTGEPAPKLEVQEISSTILRLTPEEEPPESRMPRQISFQERLPMLEGIHSSSGETREWGRSKKHSIIWILGICTAVASTVVGALMMLPKVNESNAVGLRPGQTALVLDPDEDIKETGSLSAILTRQAEAERLYHSYVTAPTTDDLLPLLRDPSALETLVRSEPRRPLMAGNQRLQKTTSWSAFETMGLTYGRLEGTLPDHSKFSAYFVLSGESLLLDWKASNAYGSARFAELERKQGNSGEIRAWISPSDFYTLAFQETEYQSYQLVSPDQQKSIWGYSRRGEAANETLNALFRRGEILKNKVDSEKITLRLEAGPEDALPNQWLIGEVLHKDWISP